MKTGSSASTIAVSAEGGSEARRFPLGALGEAILLVACIVPGLVFSYGSVQSPWNEFRIARAAISMQEQRLATFVTGATAYRAEHSGGELVLAALIETSAWPLESIALLPIGSLVLAISYYAISRKLTRSPWAAAAITLYASWYYPRLISQYASHGYAWTNSLFLTFLILLWYWLRRKTRTLSLLIMAVFIALFLHYQTTPLWAIAAIAAATGVAKLDGTSGKKLQRSVSWALPLLCAVVYFAFDTVVYGNALARFRLETLTEGWFSSLIIRIVAPTLTSTPDVLEPFVVAPVNPRIATWTTLLVILVLAVSVGSWCLVSIYQAVRGRHIGMLASKVEDIFCWAVVVAAVVHTMAYALYGAISLRVIPLAFPLILPLVLREFKLAKAIEVISAWALAALAIVGFLSYAPTLQPDILTSETGLAYGLFTAEDRLLADANTYSSLLLASAAQGKPVGFVWPTPGVYAAVTGQGAVDREQFDHFVLDLSGKPVISLGWVFLEPWTQHRQEIIQNPDLDKVYDSEKLMVFRPSGTRLPGSRHGSRDIKIVARSVGGDALRLFVSIVVLLFVPGAVLLFVLYDASLFTPEPAPTLYGLVVGLSIALTTFMGYIVSFSPLGLKWFIPLCAVLPWAALAAYAVVCRPHLGLQAQWIIRVLLLMATLLIWALLSSWVAHSRTENHNLLTEFFVTQTDPQSNSLEIHAVNRSEQARTFTIVIESDGLGRQVLGPRRVSPNSSWTETWHIPPRLLGQRLSVLLEEDGTPRRDLKIYLQQVASRCLPLGLNAAGGAALSEHVCYG